MASPIEYCLYLDEQNTDINNPYFCLAGLIISRSDYENNLIPKINELKKKYFDCTDIVFHYTDMKNNKKPFEKFQDGPTRENFWNEFNTVVKAIPFTTIGTYLETETHKNLFKQKGNRRYELAFKRLITTTFYF